MECWPFKLMDDWKCCHLTMQREKCAFWLLPRTRLASFVWTMILLLLIDTKLQTLSFQIGLEKRVYIYICVCERERYLGYFATTIHNHITTVHFIDIDSIIAFYCFIVHTIQYNKYRRCSGYVSLSFYIYFNKLSRTHLKKIDLSIHMTKIIAWM